MPTANLLHLITSIVIEFDSLLQRQLEAECVQSFFKTYNGKLNAVAWKSVGQIQATKQKKL